MLYSALVAYLTGDFAYSAELQAFWMAIQGCMVIRSGPNRNKTLSWFHAFVWSTLAGYSGASFAFLWMGRPTSMFSNDLNLAACILAFIITNYTPLDLGFRICRTLPVMIVTTAFAQLFRASGVCKFTTVAFETFKDSPSAYYPIPVFGPILYATLLGNMGGFFAKGFHDYLKDGMPWPFQNGFFCATFYHFFVHDHKGFIGTALRSTINAVPGIKFGLDDKTFATVVVSAFMHVVGILQLPDFLGPSFSPFTSVLSLVESLWRKIPKPEVDYMANGRQSISNGERTVYKKKSKKKRGKSTTNTDKEKEL